MKFKDCNLSSIDEFIEQMTLEEKIGQLVQKTIGRTENLGQEKSINSDLFESIEAGRIGSILQSASEMFEEVMRAQDIALHKSRLGIPLFVNSDIIHGFGTIFPIPLASACSFNMELIKESAVLAAEEAASAGLCCTHSPMIDIARDPRWGRIAESCGEDPYLAGEIAKAYVCGFQGEEISPNTLLLATLKHYLGYGAAEGGRDYNTAEIGENTIRNFYLPPFQIGIESGAGGVMASFNTIDGIPMTANNKYLDDVLRKELKFSGIVLSDWTGIAELMGHGMAKSPEEAVFLAFGAGIDIDMVSDFYEKFLQNEISDGRVELSKLNAAVKRILSLKLRMNLVGRYEKQIALKSKPVVFTERARQLAKDLADESIVLLKNDNVLPLRAGTTLLLDGRWTHCRNFLGCWQSSAYKKHVESLDEMLSRRNFSVKDANKLSENEKLAAAAECEYIILTLGENENESGEAASKAVLSLSEEDQKLVSLYKSCGKKIVALIFSGRPLLLEKLCEDVGAVLMCWFPGHGNEAVADILTGEINPCAKICVSFPRREGQIPVYYNHLSTGRSAHGRETEKFVSRYLDCPNEPLFPFGFGLSYTQFEYGPVNLIRNQNDFFVVCQVKNTGKRCGKEIVQLYVRDCIACPVRPIKELKGFKKIFLEAGESVDVSFKIDRKLCAYYHAARFDADDGEFIFYIGDSSISENNIRLLLQGENFSLAR